MCDECDHKYNLGFEEGFKQGCGKIKRFLSDLETELVEFPLDGIHHRVDKIKQELNGIRNSLDDKIHKTK